MQRVRKFRPGWLYLGIGCLILVIFAGCGRAVNRTAERRIREALPDLLGPARQYKVHVEGAAERTIGGRLSRVTVDGDDVELSNGLLLDHLHLDLQGVDYDTRRRQVRAIKDARFQATLSSNTLDVYLAGESPPDETIRHPRVTFGAGNQVTIAAERVTLGVGLPFRLTGPLRIAGPRRLEIDPTRLVVVGIPLTGALMRFLVQRFEGASDLSPLPFPVQLTSVQTAPGTLSLAGTADVAAILKRAQASK
jgi:hypothetical protein